MAASDLRKTIRYNPFANGKFEGAKRVKALNGRQRKVLILIIMNLFLIVSVFLWSDRMRVSSVDIAVAKGKHMLDQNMSAAPVLDVEAAKRIASEDEHFSAVQPEEELEFINAVLLSPGETRSWQDVGCDGANCAHVTFYNHSSGGTAEAVVDLQSEKLVASWLNENARPGGSAWILPRALDIAASSNEVRLILGDIGNADPAMVPMSGWLSDSACSLEWCVDLTFHDPNGTGRVYHVFVNMESNRVERTFYTRGRAERSAAEPLAQRDAYSDGCHEQYDWEVCWEMTAHDGIDFQDAAYKGRSIFRSAKIGQVEAWYPSWPGGYRDEIGSSASVPPHGDTVVSDLGNGFEVRQFFTEFDRWPNCICCYRYEEVLKFFDDGTMEFRFVSHGPGCDDLSVYRPFWRIDIDLDGPENDDVWLWKNFEWLEQALEFEEHPVTKQVTADGDKLATFEGDLHYRWKMVQTDPLERDEGYLFLLKYNDNEGDGPIITGPGDTYIPPRQWINGDDLSGENIVLWHVPLLKTIKGEPWWCMPDPDPDFSPCESILRAEPGSELVQPSPSEMATMQAVQLATPTPLPDSTPIPTPTPRPIDGVAPEEIVLNAGCTSCHQIGELGESHKVGPDLSNIGYFAQGRVEGMSASDYIRQSIIEPNVYLAPECPNGPCLENIMPRDYGHRLSRAQQESLVGFLLQQQDSSPKPPPTESPASGPPAPKNISSAKNLTQTQQDDVELWTVRIVSVLLLTLGFLISLLVYLRSEPQQDDDNGS